MILYTNQPTNSAEQSQHKTDSSSVNAAKAASAPANAKLVQNQSETQNKAVTEQPKKAEFKGECTIVNGVYLTIDGQDISNISTENLIALKDSLSKSNHSGQFKKEMEMVDNGDIEYQYGRYCVSKKTVAGVKAGTVENKMHKEIVDAVGTLNSQGCGFRENVMRNIDKEIARRNAA